MRTWIVSLALLATMGCATVPQKQEVDPAAGRAVTPDDPVRVASISKLVVAIGVMKLVERGKLDLDGDTSQSLGWSLRNPAFPDRTITLRMLLSHTSSVRDHDDQYAIPLGHTVRTVMAEPTSWDSAHGPGELTPTSTSRLSLRSSRRSPASGSTSGCGARLSSR